MKYMLRAVATALALVGSTAGHTAAIKYEGTIAPLGLVTGSVGGFGYVREVAGDVDFWSFSAVGGNSVTIRGTRLDSELDPVLDLYFGLSTADESLFRPGRSWGGLQLLTSSDDVVDPPAGPFGDPLVSYLTLPFTGIYTIAIGGGGSDGEGPYPYSLSVQVVPEPASALLVLAGLAGIGFARRRRLQ